MSKLTPPWPACTASSEHGLAIDIAVNRLLNAPEGSFKGVMKVREPACCHTINGNDGKRSWSRASHPLYDNIEAADVASLNSRGHFKTPIFAVPICGHPRLPMRGEILAC